MGMNEVSRRRFGGFLEFGSGRCILSMGGGVIVVPIRSGGGIDWEDLEPVILASLWWWGRRGIGVLLVS